jgi:protein-L-isoaspartate(D-aspartate) O-methyltransferase
LEDFQAERERMVATQLVERGIRDPAVLDAMSRVPREAFLPPELAASAYQDSPQPIEHHQTLSQPYVVGFMLEALGLHGGERVLEIGTGTGYAAAVLGCLAREVDSVERFPDLAESAALRLQHLGFANVRVHLGDGTLGWIEGAPYDGIVVAAGGPVVPAALLGQLALGGRLVMPVGAALSDQALLRITRLGSGEWREEDLGSVRFVPLVGEQGWPMRTRRPGRSD